jgi:hypothetical protein
MKSAILPPQPLDHPGSIKILLGREASEAIAANADFHFAGIYHPHATSPPDADGRLILVCLRTDKATLNAATRVILGKARAVTIKPPTNPNP